MQMGGVSARIDVGLEQLVDTRLARERGSGPAPLHQEPAALVVGEHREPRDQAGGVGDGGLEVSGQSVDELGASARPRLQRATSTA